MPRRGENIYKRKDGRWEARILKPDGKYQYIYARTYSEIKDKKSRIKDFVIPKSARISFNAESSAKLFGNWLKTVSLQAVKPTTYENYYFCVQKYVIPFFSNAGNEKLTQISVAQFVQAIVRNHRLSDAYKRKLLTIFKTALREILKESPDCSLIMDAVKLPKTENTTVQVFSVKEQRTIENAVMHSNDKRALGILLCFYTGIRLGELCALKWSDFDFEAGTLSIVKTISRTKKFDDSDDKTLLLIGTPKSRKSVRKIPMPDFILKLFQEYAMTLNNDNHYMLSNCDAPVEPRSYQKLFKRILKDAKVKDRKFHTIRHTFATRALELGVDIKTLSEILGHSNVSITLNIYAHSLMEQKKLAMDKFNVMHHANMTFDAFAVDKSVAII